MGVIYEFNWYLVAESENAYILQEDSTTYILKKSEKRIYPIGFSIPLIIKNKGCIAEVKITKVEVEEKQTQIYFSFINRYNHNDVIAQHYYDKYLDFKKNN